MTPSVSFARLLAALSLLEIEMRGRTPAEVCREAREALAARFERERAAERRGVFERIMRTNEWRDAIICERTRGYCHTCSGARRGGADLCVYCEAGREARGAA